MIRTLCLLAAILMGQPALAQPPGGDAPPAPAVAQALTSRIWSALDLEQLMPILRDEALTEAGTMQDSMFEGRSDLGWLETVAQIHDPDRLGALFRAGAASHISARQQPLLAAAVEFYETDLGRRLIGLETTARLAMLDPDTEAAARTGFSEAASHDDPRVGMIARLIEEADLIGPNVAGGMNAAIAFSQGFEAGGGFDMPLGEQQMLADAWAQEPGIRAETLGWMEAYLMLAYSPLSDAEMERYIRFAGSAEGRALSAVLFEGFDAIFSQTSRELGLAAAGQMQGRDL